MNRHASPVFIFDIGGVLIKWPNNDPIFHLIARTFGVPFGEMRDALIGKDFSRLEEGKINDAQWIGGALKKVSNKKFRLSKSLAQKLLLEPFEQKARLRKGVVEVVDSLRGKGYGVFALTNTSSTHLSYMKKVGWLAHFDQTFSSCELGCEKLAAKIFRKTLKGARTTANGAVFIDDRVQNVTGARDFGIRWPIQFESVRKLEKDIARIILESGNSNK